MRVKVKDREGNISSEEPNWNRQKEQIVRIDLEMGI